MVAAEVAFHAFWVGGGQVLVAVEGKRGGEGTHGDDGLEAVAAVDIHVMRDGAEAVSGIEIAVAVEVFVAAPEAFAIVGEEFAAKVM